MNFAETSRKDGPMGIYERWVLASRPWSFSMTAISVSVGACLASLEGPFLWKYFIWTLVGAVLVHAATNLINDCFDVQRGVDDLQASTARYRPHPLLHGDLSPLQVRNAALAIYGLSLLIGIYLAFSRGWEVLILAGIGGILSLTYTAPPLKYKYYAAGELVVFVMWGPLMVEGSYFVQRQFFSEIAFWVAIPFGILVSLVLLANNLRDQKHDEAKRILTLPILMGRTYGRVLYVTLVMMVYLAVIWMSVFGPLHLWSLIVLASLPLAFRLIRDMTKRVPDDADARTARLNTAFGVLLLISLMLGGLT